MIKKPLSAFILVCDVKLLYKGQFKIFKLYFYFLTYFTFYFIIILPGHALVQSITPSPLQRIGVSPQFKFPIVLHVNPLEAKNK